MMDNEVADLNSAVEQNLIDDSKDNDATLKRNTSIGKYIRDSVNESIKNNNFNV